MSLPNILIELAVLAVCIYTGYGFGKPAKHPAQEEFVRRMRKTYTLLWVALTFAGILIAISIADYTMLVIVAGFAIGFVASRKANT